MVLPWQQGRLEALLCGMEGEGGHGGKDNGRGGGGEIEGEGKEEGEETEGREGHRGRQIDYELSYSDALPSCLKLGHEASCGVGV